MHTASTYLYMYQAILLAEVRPEAVSKSNDSELSALRHNCHPPSILSLYPCQLLLVGDLQQAESTVQAVEKLYANVLYRQYSVLY